METQPRDHGGSWLPPTPPCLWSCPVFTHAVLPSCCLIISPLAPLLGNGCRRSGVRLPSQPAHPLPSLLSISLLPFPVSHKTHLFRGGIPGRPSGFFLCREGERGRERGVGSRRWRVTAHCWSAVRAPHGAGPPAPRSLSLKAAAHHLGCGRERRPWGTEPGSAAAPSLAPASSVTLGKST